MTTINGSDNTPTFSVTTPTIDNEGGGMDTYTALNTFTPTTLPPPSPVITAVAASGKTTRDWTPHPRALSSHVTTSPVPAPTASTSVVVLDTEAGPRHLSHSSLAPRSLKETVWATHSLITTQADVEPITAAVSVDPTVFDSDFNLLHSAASDLIVRSDDLFPSFEITSIVPTSSAEFTFVTEGLSLKRSVDTTLSTTLPGLEGRFSSVARAVRLTELSGSGDSFLPSTIDVDNAVNGTLSSPSHLATDGGLGTAATAAAADGGLSVTSEATYLDWDVSSAPLPPTPPALSATPPLPEPDSTTPPWTAAAVQSNVNEALAVSEREGVNASTAGVKNADVVTTVTTNGRANDAWKPGVAPTTLFTTTLKHASTIVTDPPLATDMARLNVTGSQQPVNGTQGDTTVSPPAPTPTPTGDWLQVSSNPTKAQPGGEANTSPHLTSSSNDLLSSDAVTDLASSSGSGGEESAVNSTSASLSTSSSVADETESSVFSVTTPLSPTASDGSGDVSGEGEGIVTTTATIVPTVITPTPSSSVVCSSSLLTSSVPGNGSLFSGDDAGTTGVPVLALVLPLSLALLVLIVLIIVMSLLCYRRGKKKKAGRKESGDDLWVEAATHHVPAISLIVPSAADPSPGETGTPLQDTLTDETDEDLYLVVHEFPTQQDTQLPLTPGDVIRVQEQADNGWWRGMIKGDDRTGWFPSSFVIPIKQADAGQAEVPEPPTGAEPQTPKPRISSFLIRKKHTGRSLKENNSFSLGKLKTPTISNNVTRSASVLTPVAPPSLSADDFTTSVRDKYFKALFAYKAAYGGELTLREGDIILGKERDRNGWMLGSKAQTKEEGWFPAVYVDQVKGDFSLVEEVSAKGDDVTSQLDHEVYGLLAVNRNKSPDQSWVGIEHRVVKPYVGQSSTQISLQPGHVVAVVEALDLGWWLGCHGDQVGWFPGDYVELLEEKSEDNSKLDSIPLLSLRRDLESHINNDDGNTASKRSSLASTVDTKDLHDRKPNQGNSKESVLSEGVKPKPARRAPKPPVPGASQLLGSSGNVSGTGTLSRNPRPSRPAPAPPSPKPRSDSVGSMDKLGAKVRSDSVGSMDRLGPSAGTDSVGGTGRDQKPHARGGVVTSRKRKPKVVRIPKEKLGLDKISSCPAPTSKPTDISSAGAIAVNSAAAVDSNAAAADSPPTQHTQGSGEGANLGESVTQSEKDSQSDSEVERGDGASLKDSMDNDDGVSTQNDDRGKHSHTDPELSGNEGTTTVTSIVQQKSGSEDSDSSSDSDSVKSDDDTSSSLSGASLPDLSREMSLDIPGLTGNPQSDESPAAQQSPPAESAADSVACVEMSPTLTVPSSQFPVTHSQPGGDADVRATSEDSKTQPADDSQLQSGGDLTAQGSGSDQREAEPVTEQDSSPEDVKRSETPSELSDSFQSPLMSETRTTPNSTSQYVPPPPALLEEAEEFSVDGPSVQSSPASSESGSISKTSSYAKPTGYWKFHSNNDGQASQSKPVKLTKVAPPVVPRTTSPSSEEEEGVVEVPHAGISGRVSKIVHQINRMNSSEEQQVPARKTSLQHNPPPSFESGVTECEEEERQGSDSQTPSQNALLPSAQPSQDRAQETPTQKPHTVANGGSASALAGHTPPVNDEHSESPVATFPSKTNSGVEGLSSAESQPERQPHSRESTPESDGEGGTRRKSSKKSRAPPPPKTPPPSSSRQLQRMAVSSGGSSEC